MMKPVPRTKREYEKIMTDEWVTGTIEDIKREKKRDTGFKDEDTGEPLIKDCVRFKFQIDGCQYPHYSRWVSFSYHEKATLYKKFMVNLIEGISTDADFDLDRLKGMKVKLMFQNNGDFQNIEMIRPLDKKMDLKLPF